MFPNKDPKEIFGEDLIQVFGPRAKRKHISKLTTSERIELCSKVPEYVDTSGLGDDPSLFQIANLILTVLKNSQALLGIDLDWLTSEDLIEKGLKRHPDSFKPVVKVVKNNEVQRGIQLRHLLLDILFVFDPKWVLMGLARYSKKEDLFYLNDAQHRYIACVILGVRDIPLEYEENERRSVDVWQYAAVNLNSLVASHYDRYRNMVQAVKSLIEEGAKDEVQVLEDTKPAYTTAWNIYNILERVQAKMIEKGGEKAKSKECTGVYNMSRHYDDYGQEIFERAVRIHVGALSSSPIASPNIWGICEFIKNQEGLDLAMTEMDYEIGQAINHKYLASRNGLHLDAKRAKKEGVGEELNIPEPSIIAGALHKLIKTTASHVKWNPIKFNNKVIADVYLKDFRVMPLQKAA